MTHFSAMFILATLAIQPNLQPCFGEEEIHHPGPRSDTQADFLFKEANEALESGKKELAILNFEKILKAYPNFQKNFSVYQNLMQLHLEVRNFQKVIDLGNQALHLHPPSMIWSAIQLMRAQAHLLSGKASQSKIIAEEILRKTPDSNTESTALIYKAEALSQLGKHKEAFASLDAAKDHPERFDTGLKIRSRFCSSKTRLKAESVIEYFREKNLCFKEGAALAKTVPSKDAAQIWCDRFAGMEAELKKNSLDEFTRQKIEAEFTGTRALSVAWGCR